MQLNGGGRGRREGGWNNKKASSLSLRDKTDENSRFLVVALSVGGIIFCKNKQGALFAFGKIAYVREEVFVIGRGGRPNNQRQRWCKKVAKLAK